jgi:hypothetical protein
MITFYYQGVAHPGDRAWVIRFATKNTEQRPEDLVKLESLIQAIKVGKDGFQEDSRGVHQVGRLSVQFVTYQFRSPLRDSKGRPATAGGVAALTSLDHQPAPLIYHMNVVNIEGDRPTLGWPEIEPLAQAIHAD